MQILERDISIESIVEVKADGGNQGACANRSTRTYVKIGVCTADVQDAQGAAARMADPEFLSKVSDTGTPFFHSDAHRSLRCSSLPNSDLAALRGARQQSASSLVVSCRGEARASWTRQYRFSVGAVLQCGGASGPGAAALQLIPRAGGGGRWEGPHGNGLGSKDVRVPIAAPAQC